MSIDHILFLASGYPSKTHPYHGSFVKELVHAFARLGKRCTVIRPVKVFDGLHNAPPPYRVIELESEPAPVTVISPRFLSCSNKKIFNFNTFTLTQMGFEMAVFSALSRMEEKPDAIYGHFLYPSGGTAVQLGRKFNIPSFVAVGESSFWTVEPLGFERAISEFSSVSGVVAVSTVLKKRLVLEIGIPEKKIGVFPNGTNFEKFFPSNKTQNRTRLRLPHNKFIVAFLGSFSERKGVMRVVEALKDNAEIGLILIGAGRQVPIGANILFKGPVPHERVPEYLSLADVFVMPTDAEGSCNAIVEAMACGLPIITSKGEFNDDLVDDTNAIRIDPYDIDAIRKAVILLKEDRGLREMLSAGAMRKAKELDINLRAKRIFEWMDKMALSSCPSRITGKV